MKGININSGQWVQTLTGDKYKSFPDVRPLTARIKKRIKPNQKTDAIEQKIFTPFQIYCGQPDFSR